MEHQNMSSTMAADSTVRSQDSNNSSDSKDTKLSDSTRASKDSSKPESCLESKHSKEVLIDPGHHQHRASRLHRQDQQQQQQQQQQQRGKQEPKDDTSLLMFTSCGQLLLGLVLVVFGVLVLVHGASLGGSGAGIWTGAAALIAGALGLVATLATSSSGRTPSGFSSAHLASSLVALALSNMAAITALTAVVRDSQRPVPDVTVRTLPDEENIDVTEGWEGLIASIGLLITSSLELIVSGYTCFTLTPKLCGCLRPSNDDAEEMTIDGKTLKTRNMVHQWVIAQNHVPKNQPIYVVQPVVPMHPMMQPPYGMPAPGKFPAGFLQAPHPAGAYGMLPPPHMGYPAAGHRPPSQMMRGKPQQKKRRHSSDQSDSGVESRQQRRSSHQHRQHSSSPEARKTPMASIGEDQIDFSRTYTGLDKRISEEFISIAMDPERKSNKASSHHGSDAGAAK